MLHYNIGSSSKLQKDKGSVERMSNPASIIAQAEQIVTGRGEKLTPLRKQVLEIIVAAGDEPLSAYQILERMGAGAKRPAPPTAYRAIDFLSSPV